MIAEAHIIDEAIDWHLRQDAMTPADWHRFVAWLEAAPDHARAYDAVALDMTMLAGMAVRFPVAAPAEAVPATAAAPAARRGAWRWAGGAVLAVAMVLAVMVAPSLTAPTTYRIATAPGEPRDIALNDGTRIELNGASRLSLDRADPRVATLETGEAIFHVRHDAGGPFVLRSGALSVEDVGTVFNVVRDGARLDVQVAEGAVLFQPGREAVMLREGAALSADEAAGRVTLSRVEPARVGGWRGGAIAFDGAPLGEVAAALRRRDGAELLVAPPLSQRPFTGMLALSGRAERDVPHIAALVGAKWRRDGERWIISPD